MKIYVRSKSSNALSYSETKKLIMTIAKSMMSAQMIKRLTITINFIDMGPISPENPGADCGWEDTNYRPREFSINICTRLSRTNQISSIVHEMVHVRQYATGQLFEYFNHLYNKYTRWKNKLVSTRVPYMKQPWEIEAYRIENVTYKKYVRMLEG